jgi:hypothetical protein
MSTSAYFNSDRAIKYGWGIPRLAILCILAFEIAPRLSSGVTDSSAMGLESYLRSWRWLTHAYIGSIGAAVNVQLQGLWVYRPSSAFQHPSTIGHPCVSARPLLSLQKYARTHHMRTPQFNIGMLLVAAAMILWDLRVDYAILVYMCKTFSGDYIAGKLDTTEWRLVLLFTSGVAACAWRLEASNAADALGPYGRILAVLALVQLICELGDNYLEHCKFFRHRYSFEACSAAIMFGLNLSAAEFRPLQHDLVICLFYRLSNGVIILAKSGDLMLLFRRFAFRVFGLLRGMRLQVSPSIRNPKPCAWRTKLKALRRLKASSWPSASRTNKRAYTLP